MRQWAIRYTRGPRAGHFHCSGRGGAGAVILFTGKAVASQFAIKGALDGDERLGDRAGMRCEVVRVRVEAVEAAS